MPTGHLCVCPYAHVSAHANTHVDTHDHTQVADNVAIIDANTSRSYTFGELHSRSLSVAAALHARGFAPGETLAIVLPNCAEYIIAILGALHARGRITAINPIVSEVELGQYLEISGARWIVTCPNAKGLPCLDRALKLYSSGQIREVFDFDMAIHRDTHDPPHGYNHGHTHANTHLCTHVPTHVCTPVYTCLWAANFRGGCQALT